MQGQIQKLGGGGARNRKTAYILTVLGSPSFKGGGASPKVSTSSDTPLPHKDFFMLLDPPSLNEI